MREKEKARAQHAAFDYLNSWWRGVTDRFFALPSAGLVEGRIFSHRVRNVRPQWNAPSQGGRRRGRDGWSIAFSIFFVVFHFFSLLFRLSNYQQPCCSPTSRDLTWQMAPKRNTKTKPSILTKNSKEKSMIMPKKITRKTRRRREQEKRQQQHSKNSPLWLTGGEFRCLPAKTANEEVISCSSSWISGAELCHLCKLDHPA